MSPTPRTPLASPPDDRDIAQRAYERWVARGRPITDGREDWFAAKAELLAERLAPSETPPPAPRRRLRSALRRLGL